MLSVGDKVWKPDDYQFPGTVVAVFHTLDQTKELYAVECSELPGLIHIFERCQLVKVASLDEL